jgi:hypothetical protein
VTGTNTHHVLLLHLLLRLLLLLLLLLQEFTHFKKEADKLHKKVALAEQDAGGNREELQHKLNKVRSLVMLAAAALVCTESCVFACAEYRCSTSSTRCAEWLPAAAAAAATSLLLCAVPAACFACGCSPQDAVPSAHVV